MLQCNASFYYTMRHSTFTQAPSVNSRISANIRPNASCRVLHRTISVGKLQCLVKPPVSNVHV